MMKLIIYLLKSTLFVMCGFIFASCASTLHSDFRRSYRDINAFYRDHDSIGEHPFLKAHLKGGGLALFTDTLWDVDEGSEVLHGNGILYDLRRQELDRGVIEVPMDSVVLYETNQKLDTYGKKSRVAATAVVATADAVLGVICLTVPKACWGSCPTFYTGQGENVFSADAEGFSEAVIPSLEYGDIDALHDFSPATKEFTIKMKNEALETHVLRQVEVLAVEKSNPYRVLHGADDRFYSYDPSYMEKPLTAVASEGDVTSLLAESDLRERYSTADPKNMVSKEEVLLTFDRNGNDSEMGLVLNFRQTLMTTYLVYTLMGYMGNSVSDFLSEWEKKNRSIKAKTPFTEALGGIDVYLEEEGKDVLCGSFCETGPIARNLQVLPLKEMKGSGKITVKLVMNRGLWRIDQASLVPLLGQEDPVALEPVRLTLNGTKLEQKLEDMRSPDKTVVSMPGDVFDLTYRLPGNPGNYDYFLYSKGYYLEWMRDSWLGDKNLPRLNMAVEHPAKFLRREAGRYARYESEMEAIFWNSRIDTETQKYHEAD